MAKVKILKSDKDPVSFEKPLGVGIFCKGSLNGTHLEGIKQQMYGRFEGFPLYSDDSAFFVGPIGHRTGQDIN